MIGKSRINIGAMSSNSECERFTKDESIAYILGKCSFYFIKIQHIPFMIYSRRFASIWMRSAYLDVG